MTRMAANKSKEIIDEYSSSLADLKFNSKPLINMLTMLADDNVEHAPAIVQAIENHLLQVSSEVKLPVLYLIDSIVKNVSGAYLKLFTDKIVNIFCSVFEKVDESTRLCMWKLRQTWGEVFPAKKLFSLDIHVRNIDPAWPVPNSSVSSGSIHLNPRFLAGTPTTPPTTVSAPSVIPSVKIPPGDHPVSVNEALMREQLLKKQKELLELQKQKVELELMQAKSSLEQQQKQTALVKAESLTSSLTLNEVKPEKVVAAVSNQVNKQVAKQFPAANASLLKNVGANNGPRIAPASSLMVASARPVSRDPRLKISSGAELQNCDIESRLRQVAALSSSSLTNDMPSKTQLSKNQHPALNTVLSDHAIKQQLLLSKQAMNHISESNQSGGGLKSSSLTSSLASNNSAIRGVGSGGSGGSGGSEAKSKDAKSSSSSRGSSSASSAKDEKSFASSKSSSSHRKLSNRSRSNSKQSQVSSTKASSSLSSSISSSSSSSSSKIVDRDASPVRSKSREKDNSDSSPTISSRTSPNKSSSPNSKNRKKSSSKSRKRTPSPPYKIPRRNIDSKTSNLSTNLTSSLQSSCLISGGVNSAAAGLIEEEQSGSLIVSPPHPPTFKEIRPNARQRNYIKRNNKDIGSHSPDNNSSQDLLSTQVTPDLSIESAASKDEDLRAVLPPPVTIVPPITEKKEDLDLRVLAPPPPPPPLPTNKRQSSEHGDSNSKKSKTEKFDTLFGNEDVDLRTLTNPKAGRPPTPPPPVISGEENKTSWAKLKTTFKNDRDKSTINEDKRDRDRTKDRSSRSRPYNKPSDDPKDRRRQFINDDDSRSSRRNRDFDKLDRNSERSIEIIMKQAEEELKQGSMTKADYHTLIQNVWQMNEVQKLRVAQKKDKETGASIWEKGIDISGGFSPKDDIGHRGKDHPHSRNGPRWQPPGPWQSPGPWAPPPGPAFGNPFNPDFRPIGPWQNPRQFGPMRPDFNQFHGFNSGMGPRMGPGPGLMGPMGPNGPMMPGMMPNGPMGPMGGMSNPGMANINGPPSLLMNGPHPPHNNLMTHVPPPTRNISPNSISRFDNEETQNFMDKLTKEHGGPSRELPLPDSKLLEEIANDTMKSINIDNIPREIRYYGQTAVVFMNWDDPREIGFQNGSRRIMIDEKDTIICSFNESYKEFVYDGKIHRIRLGAPTRELFVDDKWYECYFGGPPVLVDLGNKKININLEGPPPQVKIGTVKRTDLVIGKINLIINAKNMTPVFVDAKPQMFEIDNQPQTLEFADSLETILLNGRPFKVEFGGLPKPIIVRDKKHFIRFTVLPRGAHPGSVKIAGMKGKCPESSASDNNNKLSDSAVPISGLGLPEPDSTSQDASDVSLVKPDLQLDMLSSALSSAMAPSSGFSYQAEPMEKPPAPTPIPILPLNLNLNELYQKLVDTGIVPRQGPKVEVNKPEEEVVKKEPELPLPSLDKPETLKIVRPINYTSMYGGMQCSSCGARFAPELATRYSHHLDWHFRQNRRGRDSIKKAQSREIMYEISDWNQFEEIEDVDDRAQSWFETEKLTAETEAANGEDSSQDAIQPSVPASSDDDCRCQVCHDTFEQFYNEEKEEWHLRPAVSFEDKNYHPLCLEDHKRALAKSALEETINEDEEKKDDHNESVESPEYMETPIGNLPSDEKLKSEELKLNEDEESEDNNISQEISEDNNDKDNLDEKMVTDNTEDSIKDEEDKVIDNVNEETNDEIKTSDQSEDQELSTQSDDLFEVPVETEFKIKEEPMEVNDTETDSEINWDNVEVKTEPIDPEPEPEEMKVADIAAQVDTTLTAVTSSLDGNVELESTPATLPTASTRIKINISKPLVVNKEPEEPKEKIVLPETPSEEELPLKPASIKSTLKGRKLSILPPVERGQELSGLCSIM